MLWATRVSVDLQTCLIFISFGLKFKYLRESFCSRERKVVVGKQKTILFVLFPRDFFSKGCNALF